MSILLVTYTPVKANSLKESINRWNFIVINQLLLVRCSRTNSLWTSRNRRVV